MKFKSAKIHKKIPKYQAKNINSKLEICITYIQYLTLYYKITIVNSIPAHTNPNRYFVFKNAGVKYF